MMHTTAMTPPPGPMVDAPWLAKSEMPEVLVLDAYETCRRGDKGHCIHTQYVRAVCTHLGRTIRAPGTYKGYFHWSELVEGWGWCKFKAPLSHKYALVIDGFDGNAKHFRAPKNCPMGPVQFAGFCVKRTTAREDREERRERLNARVDNGLLVPGARFREPQTPYVDALRPQ